MTKPKFCSYGFRGQWHGKGDADIEKYLEEHYLLRVSAFTCSLKHLV